MIALWVLGAVVLLLFVGNLLLGPVMQYGWRTPAPLAELPDPLRSDLLQCTRDLQRASYYHWRGLPCQSATVNVDADGFRRTVRERQPGSDAKKVYCFGGSSTWGYTADEDTIPSKLQRILGPGFDVRNFGQNGFNSVQELNLLMERLAQGDRPAIVIFYNGAIDALAGTYEPAIPREVGWPGIWEFRGNAKTLALRLWHHSNYSRLARRLVKKQAEREWEGEVLAQLDANADRTIREYGEFVRQAMALSKEYGFKAYFFWEPDLLSLTKKNPSGLEREIIAGSTFEAYTPVTARAIQAVYTRAQKAIADGRLKGVVWLGSLFDDDSRGVFHDDAHLDPVGNQRVAGVIAKATGF